MHFQITSFLYLNHLIVLGEFVELIGWDDQLILKIKLDSGFVKLIL